MKSKILFSLNLFRPSYHSNFKIDGRGSYTVGAFIMDVIRIIILTFIFFDIIFILKYI